VPQRRLLARDKVWLLTACIAGKPAPTPIATPRRCRLSRRPQAACAAMTTLMVAEVWVGAGLPAIGPCQAPHAVGHVPGRKDSCSHLLMPWTDKRVEPRPVGAGLPAMRPAKAHRLTGLPQGGFHVRDAWLSSQKRFNRACDDAST
jgi:hypothetical protein